MCDLEYIRVFDTVLGVCSDVEDGEVYVIVIESPKSLNIYAIVAEPR
jgi:hypothetical protein